LPAHRELDLSRNGINDAGAAALAVSPHLGRLTHLGLRNNGISNRGALALATSPHLAALRCLDVTASWAPLDARGKSALTQRFGKHVRLDSD
jgi:Leucine Rich repeat